jgi:DNA-binding transcriptional regulator GbsR (MarR family)
MILNNKSRVLFHLRKCQFDDKGHSFDDLLNLLDRSKGRVSTILNELEQEGLISIEMVGKRKKYFLIEKGTRYTNMALCLGLRESEIEKLDLISDEKDENEI